MTGIKRMLEAIERSTNAEELNNPTNYKEEHNKQVFPEICSESCEHYQCPFHRPENYGKPCVKHWEQYKTPPPPLPRTSGLQHTIEKAVAQAFKPLTNRLEALENQAEYERQPHLRGFNGSPIPAGFPRLYRESLRGDTVHNG